MRRLRQCGRVAAAAGLALCLSGAPTLAQVPSRPPETPKAATPISPPEQAAALTNALDALYLTEAERRELRIFHGVWTAEDLVDVLSRARAALAAGVYDDPALADMKAAPEDRAEAALERGDLEQAAELAAPLISMRGIRIRAAALEALGRYQDADAAVEPIARQLLESEITSAEDLTEAAKALRIRARVQGRPASDFTHLMQLLSRASQQLDRLYWPAILEQADLLYDKDNPREAMAAAVEALSLNPRAAKAWAILGRMAVDAFDFGRSEGVALRLEEIERETRGLDGSADVASPFAAEIRARASLRQNDPDFAHQALAGALERYDRDPELLAMSAAATALRYDWEALENALAQFDHLAPGSPLALYEVGRTLSENRQYDRAAEYLERAEQRQPNWPQPVIELGLLEMQSGRDERALAALRRATRLDEFNVRARNSLRLIEELVTYDAVETDHFTIRYKPGTDEVLAREMAGPLEEIYRVVTQGVEHEPDRKTVIELLPDHEWFAVRITGMTGIHTIAASTGPVIAMESPREGKKHFGVYDWVRVLRHEFVHTVTLSRTNYRIPLWFTEAAAVFLENSPLDYQTAQLLTMALTQDQLFDLQEVNVAFVRPKKPSDRAQGYAQGHWMYRFMRERWGPQAPLTLMDLYAAGVREDAAMRQALGVSQEEFLSAFREWARDDARSWGMLPDRTFVDLLREASMADPIWQAQAEAKIQTFALTAGLWPTVAHAAAKLDIPLLPISRDLLDRMLERSPGHPDVLKLRADSLLNDNGGQINEETARALEEYAAARPVDPMPHRLLAKHYLDGPMPEKAIPHLEYLDAREQHSAAYAAELIKRYSAIGDLKKAWTKALRATRVAPFDAGHRELAATVAIRRGDLAEAERFIETLTLLEPHQEIHRKRLERIREMRRSAENS